MKCILFINCYSAHTYDVDVLYIQIVSKAWGATTVSWPFNCIKRQSSGRACKAIYEHMHYSKQNTSV